MYPHVTTPIPSLRSASTSVASLSAPPGPPRWTAANRERTRFLRNSYLPLHTLMPRHWATGGSAGTSSSASARPKNRRLLMTFSFDQYTWRAESPPPYNEETSAQDPCLGSPYAPLPSLPVQHPCPHRPSEDQEEVDKVPKFSNSASGRSTRHDTPLVASARTAGILPSPDAMAAATSNTEASAVSSTPTVGGHGSPPRISAEVHRQHLMWLAGAMAQAGLFPFVTEACNWMAVEQAIVADFCRADTISDLGEALKLTKTQLQRLRTKIEVLGPALPPFCRPLPPPAMRPPPFKAAEERRRRPQRCGFPTKGHVRQAAQGGACGLIRPTPKRQPTRSLSPKAKKKRPHTHEFEDIAVHISSLGLYPERFSGLRREQNGSFSIESLMSYWGKGAGLSVETIMKALQANLFKNLGSGKPKLRFSISQGPDTIDLVMIKVLGQDRC